MTRRVQAFIVVGIAGFVLQLGMLYWLADGFHWPYPLATLVAVEAAVVHNFFWHETWTWADRQQSSAPTAQRLMRFHLGTGLTSLVGNVVVTTVLVEAMHLPALLANATAVVATSLLNFLIADRWVFSGTSAALMVCLMFVAPANASAASPTPAALAAWDQHITALEATLRDHEVDPAPSDTEGRTLSVEGGAIHEWRGATVIHGVTVSRLVTALVQPGLPPPAEDILDARVLGRSGDTLHLYMKVARSAMVTVTYDTEHDVTFVRHSSTFATSRSASTGIREIGGTDHGFLWRLNSYWRYRQRGEDVIVDVLSVSLSRDVPWLVRPIAAPVINQVARESMQRTLDAVNRFGEALRNCREEPPVAATAR